MQNYPRKDGTWNVYLVQSLYNNEGDKWGTYTWVETFDTRERIEAMGLDYEDTTLKASGKIWQQSGIHGTTSLEYARVLLRLCRAEYPQHAHRIVDMCVSRTTTEVEA